MAKYVEIGMGLNRVPALMYRGLEEGDEYYAVDPPELFGCEASNMASAGLQPRVPYSPIEIPVYTGDDFFILQSLNMARQGFMVQRVFTQQTGVEITVVREDGRQMSFGDGTIDEVVMSNVISDPEINSDDKRDLIRESIRVIKKAGQIALVDIATADYAERFFAESLTVDLIKSLGRSVRALRGSQAARQLYATRFETEGVLRFIS